VEARVESLNSPTACRPPRLRKRSTSMLNRTRARGYAALMINAAHTTDANVLMARRLVERGVPACRFIQVKHGQ
jgi:hypothetical protein